MLRIAFYDAPASLPAGLRDRIEGFLACAIPEGTVVMPPSAYRAASAWSVVSGDEGEVLGFAAHRMLRLGRYTVVQVMATFLARALRGRGFASLLLQGRAFLEARRAGPLRPLLWCTRTRVPGAYVAASRLHRVYPRLDRPEHNAARWPLAAEVARAVYGPEATLDPQTFVLRGSYAPGSRFLPLPRLGGTGVTRYFLEHLDYTKNEAVFVMARLNPLHLLTAAAALAAFEVAGLPGRLRPCQGWRHA